MPSSPTPGIKDYDREQVLRWAKDEEKRIKKEIRKIDRVLNTPGLLEQIVAKVLTQS